MSFAQAYLDKVSLDPQIEFHKPGPNLSLVIAIPASNEPLLINTLSSILKCSPPKGEVEVIITLNSAANAPESVGIQNLITAKEIDDLKKQNKKSGFSLLYTNITGIKPKLAGAGFARKIAMDHALGRFNLLGNPNGIILSLDADTLCDRNYLVEVEKHFTEIHSSTACSIYFEHPLEGREFPAAVYEGIIQYELHLRYFIEGLRHAGHPHAYHTVGSAFAIKAGTYARQGGMNKRSAGEDFYFLHKIIPLGNYHDLNSTRVIPSPRPSNRVAFGTGPVIDQFLSGKLMNLESYDPRAFNDLRIYVADILRLYSSDDKIRRSIFESWPETIRNDIHEEFFERVEEINNNCSESGSFMKRYFNWFNVFRTLKYLNNIHRKYYKKIPVKEAVPGFLNNTSAEYEETGNARKNLEFLRMKQRERIY